MPLILTSLLVAKLFSPPHLGFFSSHTPQKSLCHATSAKLSDDQEVFPRPVSHIQCFFILVFTIPSYCRRRQRSRIFSCHRHSSLAAAVLNYYPPPSLVASVLSITAAKSPPSPLSNATNFVSFRPITHQRHE